MPKRLATLILDTVGLGDKARDLRVQWRRRWRRHQQAAGHGEWAPLVPEQEYTECVRRGIRKLLETESKESLGDYIEFGVSRGTSMSCAAHVLTEEGLDRTRLIGFDSFEGMPPESAGQGWDPGQYASTLSATRRYLAEHGVDLKRTSLIKGWFKDTLTPDTLQSLRLGKVSLIMVDCDIYTATQEALAFCGPLIDRQAIMFFDDWGWRSNKGLVGEKEAFEEFLAAHPDLYAEPMPRYLPQARVFHIKRCAG